MASILLFGGAMERIEKYELSSFAYFVNNKIDAKQITTKTYVTTESMKANRGGVVPAANLPDIPKFTHFKKTDTLFSNIRTYFRKVWLAEFDGGASADVLVIRTKDVNKLNPIYLFYLLSSKAFSDYTVLTAKGVKMPRGDKDAMMQYKFYVPSLEYQVAAAHYLKSIDDKIAINQQINQTLESIAQALFKSWFVDFEPTRAKIAALQSSGSEEDANLAAMTAISGKSADELAKLKITNPEAYAELHATASLFPSRLVESELGEAPKGWEVKSIYEISDVIYGAPFKSKLFNTEGNGTPLVRIRDLENEVPGVYTLEQHSKGYLIENGDLIVGMDGEFRPYIWGGNNAWMNQRICCFKPKKQFNPALIKEFISPQLNYLEKTATATTVIHLGKGDIDRFAYLHPGSDLLKRYCKFSNPIYSRVVSNKVSNKILTQLRDSLLPKLLSGEISVDALQAKGVA